MRYCASIGENRPWITYSNSNEGEPNYYRDAYNSFGELMYCDGEAIKVILMGEKYVTFKSELAGSDPESKDVFTISRKQFDADFTPVHVKLCTIASSTGLTVNREG